MDQEDKFLFSSYKKEVAKNVCLVKSILWPRCEIAENQKGSGYLSQIWIRHCASKYGENIM